MDYISKHLITGRGLIYVVNDLDVKLNDIVIFDEVEYIVTGIESSQGLFGVIAPVGVKVRRLDSTPIYITEK